MILEVAQLQVRIGQETAFEAAFSNALSPPVDSKANAELIALVANQFDVGKSHVTIKSGVSGRRKLITIDQP